MKDIIKNELNIGDMVAFATHNSLVLGIISNITPKMVRVKRLGSTRTNLKYSSDLIKIEGPTAVLYLLKYK